MTPKRKDRQVCVDDLLTLVSLPCGDGGALHRIGLGTDGALRFYDHSSTELALMGELMARAEMAHDLCACGKVMRDWKQENYYRLPAPLDTYRSTLRAEARKGRKGAPKAPDEGSFKNRARHRVRDAARADLERVQYRVSPDHTWNVNVADRGAGNVECSTSRTWNKQTRSYDIKSTCDITLPMRWLTAVHNRGFGVVLDHFVLDVLSIREDGHVVLRALKQYRGFTLQPAGAVYDPATGVLQWM